MLQLNDRRVIQLSTAVRSISKSPYIVKDFLKIERGKWNVGLFHFSSVSTSITAVSGSALQ